MIGVDKATGIPHMICKNVPDLVYLFIYFFVMHTDGQTNKQILLQYSRLSTSGDAGNKGIFVCKTKNTQRAHTLHQAPHLQYC